MRYLGILAIILLVGCKSTETTSVNKDVEIESIDRCVVYSWVEPNSEDSLVVVSKDGMYFTEVYIAQDSFYLEYSPYYKYNNVPIDVVTAVAEGSESTTENDVETCENDEVKDTLKINYGKDSISSFIPFPAIDYNKKGLIDTFDTISVNVCDKGYESIDANGYTFEAEGLPVSIGLERNYYQYCQPITYYSGQITQTTGECVSSTTMNLSCYPEPNSYERNLISVPSGLKRIGYFFVFGVVPDSLKNTTITWDAILTDMYGKVDTVSITSFLKDV